MDPIRRRWRLSESAHAAESHAGIRFRSAGIARMHERGAGDLLDDQVGSRSDIEKDPASSPWIQEIVFPQTDVRTGLSHQSVGLDERPKITTSSSLRRGQVNGKRPTSLQPIGTKATFSRILPLRSLNFTYRVLRQNSILGGRGFALRSWYAASDGRLPTNIKRSSG